MVIIYKANHNTKDDINATTTCFYALLVVFIESKNLPNNEFLLLVSSFSGLEAIPVSDDDEFSGDILMFSILGNIFSNFFPVSTIILFPLSNLYSRTLATSSPMLKFF
jgi:hypothetical protein